MPDNTGLKLAVQALREAPAATADKFAMHWFTRECGTPACVLGHLAARTDLQQEFTLNRKYGSLQHDGGEIGVSDDAVLAFFDITPREANALFDTGGCGNAKSRVQAIEYLEKFIEARGG